MKKLEAIINPVKLDTVKNGLVSMGVKEMTICRIEELQREAKVARVFRGAEYEVGFLPKVKIEFVLPDAIVEQAVHLITSENPAGTGGSGRVVVLPVEDSPGVGGDRKRAMAA